MTTVTSHRAAEPTAPTLDWLYVRAYAGRSRDTDGLLRTVWAWVKGLGPRERWHFLRYIDADGQHLRVRVSGPPDDVDRWFGSVGALEDAVCALPVEEREHVLDDPLVSWTGSRRGTSLGVYSPEIHKYGTGTALRAAEHHFDTSSTWCVEHAIWRWSSPTRVAAALEHLLAVADHIGDDFLTAHNSTWLPRLRTSRVDREGLERARDEVLAARAELSDDDRDAVRRLAASLRDTGLGERRDAGRAVQLAHMDLNRLGVNPVEEGLAGVLASSIRKGVVKGAN